MPVSISGAGSISGLDQGFNVTTGSVGVGTDNPHAKLEVSGGQNQTANQFTDLVSIAANANNDSLDAEVQLNLGISPSHTAEANRKARIQSVTHGGTATPLLINPAGGNIGIGENNPSTVLHVAGSLTLENSSATGNAWTYYKNADRTWLVGVRGSSNDALSFYDLTADVERFRISSTGHLLQGTTTEGAPGADNLTLASSGTAGMTIRSGTSGNGNIYFSDSTSGAAEYDGFIQYQQSNQAFRFATAGTERLLITSAGKLTVTPADTTSSYATTDGGIDIAQTISSTGTSASQSIGIQFSLTKSGQTGAIAEIGAVREGSGLSALVFRTRDNSTGRNERLRISSDGKVCVGTTLTNYGVLQIRDASGDSTTSAIQVENASSGNSTTNVILRSVSLNSGAWANAEYRAKSHVFSHQTSPILIALANFGPWAEGNKGTTRGTLHLRPQSTDHMGGAITFGASDRDSGDTAMAGIYTRTDGNYGTKMYFATTDSYAAGPRNAMTIDHYGRVTTQRQPSFLAYNITTRAQGTNLVFASTYHNTGSHYNTANGIFTAPVAGHYMFSFALLHSSSPTSYARVLFSKNGTATTQHGDTLISEPGTYVPTSATSVFYMNANDTMRLYNEGNDVYGYQYGSFSGHLLG